MDGILWTLGTGAAALFGVALAVSAWEHFGAPVRRNKGTSSPPPMPTAAVAAVDVDLDEPAGDVERRRGILDGALQRMTQPGALVDEPAPPWVETAPMVGPRAEPPRDPLPR